MKNLLTKLCWPILASFEKSEGEYVYKPLNRKILIVLGVLFLALTIGIAFVVINTQNWAGFLPVIIFGAVGVVCIVVGTLGTERAVAKIWGSK